MRIKHLQIRTVARIALTLVVMTSVLAAAVVAQSNPPNTTNVGLHYWLPVDMASLDVAVTTKTTRDYEEAMDPNAKPLLRLVTHREVERNGTLSIRTIADHSVRSHTLDVVPGKMADTGIGIDISAGGILQSVSPSSTGRAGDIIQAVAKFAATAFSLTSLGGLGVQPLSNAHKNLFQLQWKQLPNTASIKATPPPETCDPFSAPFTTQPIRVRAFVAQSEEGCFVFWRIHERGEALAEFQSQRLRLEGLLDTTPQGDLPALRGNIQDRTKAINATQEEVATLQARFAALLAAFTADKKLGTVAKTEHFSRVFPLNTIRADLATLSSEQSDFFSSTGVVVLGAPLHNNTPQPATDPDDMDGKIVRIAFRQSTPWHLEVRSSKCAEKEESGPCANPDAPTDANTELTSAEIRDLIDPTCPTSILEFKAAAFGDKKLAIVFDEKGRPTRLQRNGTSSAAALAMAVSDASRAARDEYATSLSKLVDIRESQRRLSLSDITTKIEDLKKQKELLDAKLGLNSASQSFDVLLQQNQLNAEMDLLQAQLAQQSAQAGFDQDLELAELKRELEQVKVQVDLVKAQQELEKLNGKK